jgi:hypothetical protein
VRRTAMPAQRAPSAVRTDGEKVVSEPGEGKEEPDDNRDTASMVNGVGDAKHLADPERSSAAVKALSMQRRRPEEGVSPTRARRPGSQSSQHPHSSSDRPHQGPAFTSSTHDRPARSNAASASAASPIHEGEAAAPVCEPHE